MIWGVIFRFFGRQNSKAEFSKFSVILSLNTLYADRLSILDRNKEKNVGLRQVLALCPIEVTNYFREL